MNTSTTRRRSFPVPLTTVEKVQIVGLALAGLGILALYLGGLPGFPTVPPGPIIMIGLAAVILFVRWRWISVLGLIATIGIGVGFIATMGDAVDRLADPARVVFFGGTIGQFVGLLVALVAGVLALVIALRSRRTS